MKFTINEKEFAESMLPGPVMLERVRKMREKLTVDQDYIVCQQGVLYSKSAVKKMAAMFHVEPPSLPAPVEKKRVTQLCPYQGNRKYLRGVEEGTGLNVTVHVKDNTNFTRDMTIDVVKGFAGAWDYLGPLPRSRGRM